MQIAPVGEGKEKGPGMLFRGGQPQLFKSAHSDDGDVDNNDDNRDAHLDAESDDDDDGDDADDDDGDDAGDDGDGDDTDDDDGDDADGDDGDDADDDDGDDADDVAKECGAGWDSGGELRAGGLWMEKALQGRPTTQHHTKRYSIFHL